MQKKVVVLLVSLLAIASVYSWAATTYQIQTKLNSGGGSIKVPTRQLQTTPYSIWFTNFTTSAPVPVAVSANLGYKIATLFRNNTTVTLPNNTSSYTTSFLKKDGSTQSLSVSFAMKKFNVTTNVISGDGSFAPASSQVYYNGSMTLSVIPRFQSGVVTQVLVNGLPYQGATLPYPGTLQIAFTNITSNRAVSASFATITATMGPKQYVATNTPVTMSGSSSGGADISWEFNSGPAWVDTSQWQTTNPVFTPPVKGDYSFTMKASVSGTVKSSVTASVTALDDVKSYVKNKCFGCHAAGGNYPNPYVFTGWSSSGHRWEGVNCYTCHGDGAMPTPVNDYTVNKMTFVVAQPNAGTVGTHYCSKCHAAGAVHKTAGMLCSNCHSSAATHNLDVTFGSSLNVCFSCHGAVNTAHFYTKNSIPVNQCLYCHQAGGHNPLPHQVTLRHFNGYTSVRSASYAAAYVTPVTSCADCHQGGDPVWSGDTALAGFRQQWAASRHGSSTASWRNSRDNNWKSSGTFGANAKASAGIVRDCQRCHSATGYLQFARFTSIAPVASATAYSEPLTCNACHNSGDFSAPLSFGPRTGYYNYSSAATGRISLSAGYPEAGRSNICLGCHVGTQAGSTIKKMAQAVSLKDYSTSFWQDLSFVDSHYLSAGGQVYAKTGYEYPGASYGNGGVNHSGIGAENAAGPCVACHMPGSTHTLSVSGESYLLCNKCHKDTVINESYLTQRSTQFRAALKALGAALSFKGVAPNLDQNEILQAPPFGTRNWGTSATAPGVMGAAFNYNLLVNDPGAYAHNPTYAKRLLRDSIDYLVNGEVARYHNISTAIKTVLPDTAEREDASAFLNNAGSGNSACSVCHSDAIDPQSEKPIFEQYNASMHSWVDGGATCASCHATGQDVAHPPAALLSSAVAISDNCYQCHKDKLHTWPSIGKCMNCHNAHNPGGIRLGPPHYGNFSSAQYITTNLTCDNCHTAVDEADNTSFNIYTANSQWARSGKGNVRSPSWTSFDFKTMGSPAPANPTNSAATDCVRCHTTTGYINYVTSNFRDIRAWGTSALAPDGDRKREMIACSACHNPTPFRTFDSEETDDWGDPLEWAFGRRVVPEATVFYNYSGGGSPRVLKRVMFEDQGASNNCVICHSGTRSGATLREIGRRLAGGASAAFWNSTPLIDPHGMGAAGILYGKSGYTYPITRSRNYSARHGFAHPFIDDYYYGGQGPCVACHFYTDKPHVFSAVSSANGRIQSIASYDYVCSECHERGLQPVDLANPANLDTKKQAFISSLKALATALTGKGIHFNPEKAPYFFTSNLPAQQTPEGAYRTWNANYDSVTGAYAGMDVMGAAFNLRLLWAEKGAYTHNSYYTKRLIYDSIDFLDDSALNSSVAVTLQNMAVDEDGFFTSGDKTRAQAYIGVRP